MPARGDLWAVHRWGSRFNYLVGESNSADWLSYLRLVITQNELLITPINLRRVADVCRKCGSTDFEFILTLL